MIAYSVVIPFKNEEGNVIDLVEELEPIMTKLGKPWELICIEDGSNDRTQQILLDLAKKKPYMRILIFNKNYGQSSAFDAGFKAARGEFVITLDGDRQNDPTDIPKLVEAVKDCDMVCGWRVNRRDPLSKRLWSRMAYKARCLICKDGVHDTGCSLKIYRTSCLKHIKMFNGMHRLLPALFNIEGFRVKEIPVNHRERTQGKTKYNFFNRSFNTVADLWAVRWMQKRHLHYKIDKEIPR